MHNHQTPMRFGGLEENYGIWFFKKRKKTPFWKRPKFLATHIAVKIA